MDGQFLAQILQIAFNYAPKSWAYCAAQQLSIAQNQALFSILGTTYGGNGVTTFALPDLRGRVPMHWGTGPGLTTHVLGEASGTQQVTILPSNLPLHNHALNVFNGAPGASSPSGNVLASGPVIATNNTLLYGTTPNAIMAPTALATAGNTNPISIMQPYQTVGYVIALQGIFPSRN